MHPLRVNTLSVAFLFCFIVVSLASQLETVYQWRYFDYVWPSKSVKQNAIKSGAYNYSQIIPMDVDVSQDGRVFVTLNNYFGTPARLGVVSNTVEYSGPLLKPYPSWKWYEGGCNSLIDVLRIEIDRCNRLWVIDGGRQEPNKIICPSKLLAFDLWTDTLLKKVDLPKYISQSSKTGKTLLSNVKVETYGPRCHKTTVYMTDAAGNALIVYNGKSLRRLESPTFNAVPGLENITTNGLNTNLSLGISGMDLLPKVVDDGLQYLYFRPSTSLDLYAVKTEELKFAHKSRPIQVLGVKNALKSQSLALTISSCGAMFLAPVHEHSIICWNVCKHFDKNSFITVAQDHERLQFTTSLKVISKYDPFREELWTVSNRFQAFKYNLFNFHEFNFHILKTNVEQLIKGTNCEKPSGFDDRPRTIPRVQEDRFRSYSFHKSQG